MTGYTLHVTATFDDGDSTEWTYDRAGADARAAFDDMRRRWRDARIEHTADKAALILSRRVTSRPEIGEYVDTLTYIPWEPEA